MADKTGTPPATNAIAQSGSDGFEATKTAAMAIAAHIGQIAAMQRLQTGQLPPGMSVPTNAMAPPNATPMPMPIPQGGQPDTHSQYDNPAQANSAARTDVVNQIVDMANKAKAAKVQADTIKASKDYETLMNAINFNKTLNPKDPQQAALIQHNNDIINNFFSDPKRADRLQKIMGYDAYDMKAEAKKQKDPEYQAFQLALKNSGKTVTSSQPTSTSIPGSDASVPGSMDLTLGPSATPPTPAGMKQSDANSVAAGQANVDASNPWASGLNPAAQKFINQMPVGRGPTQYIPSPEEHASIFRIANGLEADAKTKSSLVEALVKYQSEDLGHLATNLRDMDVAKLKARFDDNANLRDNTTRWNVSLLQDATERAKLAFEKGKAEWDHNKEDADKSWTAFNNMQSNQLKVIDGIQAQTKVYEDIVKSKDADGDQKRYAVTALNKLHAEQAQEFEKYHSIQQDFQHTMETKHGIKFSEPAGTNAANAVNSFDQQNGGPSATDNGSAGTSATVPVSGSSGGHSSAAWERRIVLPISNGPTVPTNFGPGGSFDSAGRK